MAPNGLKRWNEKMTNLVERLNIVAGDELHSFEEDQALCFNQNKVALFEVARWVDELARDNCPGVAVTDADAIACADVIMDFNAVATRGEVTVWFDPA